MLVCDMRTIGDKMWKIRKKAGLTQAEVAELSGISDRTYADIERGTVNMRIDTVLRICSALKTTPDELFVEDSSEDVAEKEILARLELCSKNEKETALKLLAVYLNSLK